MTPETHQPKQEQPAKEKLSSEELDYLAWLTLMAMEARESAKTPQPHAPTPAAPPAYQPPPVQPQQPVANNVQILPGVPNPNSGKTYMLQVGAFSATETAFQAFQQVKAAGFDAVLEQAGNLYRVLAIGIPAKNVYFAAQRLGAFGFRQVIVRE